MMKNRSALNSANLTVFVAVLLLVLPVELGAQTRDPNIERGVALASQPRGEVTISGTVDRLLTQPLSPGSPAGAHLLISASGKTVDAHLGPRFSRQNRDAMTAGQPVEVTGVLTQIHGQEVLLVRQLTFEGHTVTVRNQRGFLVGEHPARRVNSDRNSAPNGGAQ